MAEGTVPTTRELEWREVTSGLKFPEGPIAMDDGSVILVELARRALTRVDVSTGDQEVVATVAGPNGAAVGPDGLIYVANNGGYFAWHEMNDMVLPGGTPDDHVGGSIDRIDPATGTVETLYDSCDGHRLVAPNDLVLDGSGGIWITDHGIHTDDPDGRPGVLYAKVDGSGIEGKVHGTDSTNGVGLSPAGDRLYVAETVTGTLWAWTLSGPGAIAAEHDTSSSHSGGELLYDAPDGHLFDSLAVDGEGWVCVATIGQGGISAVAPDGSVVEHSPIPDPVVTNICFGGPAHGSDDYRTAYVTASSSGRLLQLTWPRPGFRLPH